MNSRDRLTISFWIWGIFDLKSNPYYDDLERRFVELRERGFNCIRLESGAGLCHDKDGRPRGELAFQEWMPGGHVRMFRGSADRFMEGRCDPLKRLIELCTLAQRYDVKVMGEGASYCALAAMRWEERSDAYWEVVEHAARAYSEHGLWGAVARTCGG